MSLVFMAQKVVAMEDKLAAVFAAQVGHVRVTALCAELGISRQSFYKYRQRWELEGVDGLRERSRRPHHSPAMTSAAVEDEIVRLRKTLPLDNGPQTIAYQLERTGWDVPSIATIHRILTRRGQITPQPAKRPRSSWHRFEWPAPNAAWQIDATHWSLADATDAWIMDVLDDHSRVLIAARTCRTPTGEAAWAAFCDGAQRYGTPAHVMSDNGTCFTAKRLSGGQTGFERDLRLAGVVHITSTPGHPQTCGKIERFHQTLKKWLATQPAARTLHELDTQLDYFTDYYNNQRPHRALHGATPAERWHATPAALPGLPIADQPHASLHTVLAHNNVFSYGKHRVAVGPGHNRQRVLVITRDDELTVFSSTGIIRRLHLDRTRNYQPNT